MKYLSHYTKKAQTDLLTKIGAFCAFNKKQFDEAKKPDTIYVSLGVGMFVPKQNVKDLVEGLESIAAAGIKADIAENGIKAIIHRELGNHEAQITYCLDDTVDVLKAYGITREAVGAEWAEYLAYCIEHDYF